MAIYIDTDRTSNSYCMLKFTWSNRTLVHHVASQIARNGDIIEILDNLALLSLDARLAILYQLTDVRLRRLECEGTRPGEIYNERVGEFNVELQIMWSFHCETNMAFPYFMVQASDPGSHLSIYADYVLQNQCQLGQQ